MTSRTITTDEDLVGATMWLAAQKRPFTIDVTQGKRRTNQQNRLQRDWINQIAAQLGDQTAEEWRGYCKLTMGVPILRAENDRFCEQYDRIIKPLPYEQKLELMGEPFDFPVTRLMNTKQKTTYLDAMHKHFTAQGVILTEPDMRNAA